MQHSKVQRKSNLERLTDDLVTENMNHVYYIKVNVQLVTTEITFSIRESFKYQKRVPALIQMWMLPKPSSKHCPLTARRSESWLEEGPL